jgi:heme exporter protein C
MALLQNKPVTIEHSRSETSRRASGVPLVESILWALTLPGIMLSIWLAFVYAPMDAIEGQAQRIFYFHVPVSWLGMLAFVIMAGAGALYLWKQDERWDWLARAAAELGTLFITLALITGSIWGRSSWGTWWTWDARLTTTLVLWFVYISYLMLRNYMGRTPASARAGAVMSLICVVDVPIIYESVNWWRTLHPSAEVGVAGALPDSVVLTLCVALVSFTILFAALLIQVYHLQRTLTLAQRLRASLE